MRIMGQNPTKTGKQIYSIYRIDADTERRERSYISLLSLYGKDWFVYALGGRIRRICGKNMVSVGLVTPETELKNQQIV